MTLFRSRLFCLGREDKNKLNEVIVLINKALR